MIIRSCSVVSNLDSIIVVMHSAVFIIILVAFYIIPISLEFTEIASE